jgi:hypothetical protein
MKKTHNFYLFLWFLHLCLENHLLRTSKGETTMRIGIKAILAAAGLMAAMVPSAVMQAQQVPGPHPAYFHALDDLRAARGMLADHWQWGRVKHDDEAAIREIDAAINEIKHAAIDDGKSLNDYPPIDARLSPHDRFRRANELLAAAHRDLDHAEDVPQARGLRNRAVGHIDAAHQIVDAAWRNAQWWQ